ncbi:MBL fold metallo-hydrolase [Ottowia thiooxydans]|uniref:MBL fold metallo-hydrolase n=1 Tax=Ottowia thiooxydans TaxID=219182 RepID=UPI0004067DFA|nr:MBL fold metallo-hydrolase [Ottowia thiooxydans]
MMKLSRWWRILVWLVLAVLVLCAGTYAYLQQAKFGALPQGARLDAARNSPNHGGEGFRNLVETPIRTTDSGFVANIWSMMWDSNERLKPIAPIPAVKRDLRALDRAEDLVVWLGHSSYFIQIGGKRILIDPVFSTDAAPAPYLNAAFSGSTPYTAEDIPDIDYLLISHDHWDHLDHPSALALRERVRHVVTGLGVGANFERWGYLPERIHEADWNAVLKLDEGLSIHVLPARHFSGRLLLRNQTLWVAYALVTPQRRMFFSGDSGYGPHFLDIGKQFGGFDFAALDAGQYDPRWAHVHMFPEQAAQAAEDLGTKVLVPGHAGRFKLAAHDWDEPFERLMKASQGRGYRLLTPPIGEIVRLGDATQTFASWWRPARP